MTPTTIDIVATILFACALTHTFLVKKFEHLAHKYPEGSVGENFFHLLGEVEAVFGIWAIFLFTFLGLHSGFHHAIEYIEGLNFTEPAFVFVIMVLAATKPILDAATTILQNISKLIPLKKNIAFYLVVLCFGPLLGSFITEPAAMAVTALILKDFLFSSQISDKFKYATLGLLFVNISIGGTLTHFAAPPVIMVAEKWGWDMAYMFTHFGYKAALSVVINTSVVCFLFRKEFQKINGQQAKPKTAATPIWITFFHLAALMLVVVMAHHPIIFIGILLLFLGFATITREYQNELKIREGLLVGLFLGGLIILGSLQRWWLEPILTQLGDLTLFLGSMGLTAITDNAALTYLGSLVPGLSEFAKYSLVAGSVIGGGLTVVANAPNPIGFGILNSSFGEDGISPLNLLLGALGPTICAALIFWLL